MGPVISPSTPRPTFTEEKALMPASGSGRRHPSPSLRMSTGFCWRSSHYDALIAAGLPVCRPALKVLSFPMLELSVCICPSRCMLQLHPSHVQQLWRYAVEPTTGYNCAADLHFAWCAALRSLPHDIVHLLSHDQCPYVIYNFRP